METTNLTPEELKLLRKGLRKSWGSRVRIAGEFKISTESVDKIMRGQRPNGISDLVIQRVIEEVEKALDLKKSNKERVGKIYKHYENLDKKVS